MFLLPKDIPIQQIKDPVFTITNIQVNVLRLDLVHPIVSGNKIFKLYYFLQRAEAYSKAIVTYGGAYSNHLIATAFACNQLNIPCTGIVRGERPATPSLTLLECEKYGMQLIFTSREAYKHQNDPAFLEKLYIDPNKSIIIPEGGFHQFGAKGASLIMDYIHPHQPTHICCAVGTATTLAGLILNNKEKSQIVGLNVLKGLLDVDERIQYLTEGSIHQQNYTIIPDYHFGGYAKKTPDLLKFMNYLWGTYQLPTDFVYTSKVFFGVLDLIEKQFFPPQSNIMIIHTGGLQGNNSLPEKTLLF